MEVAMKLRCVDLRSSFLPTSSSLVGAPSTTRVAVSTLRRNRTIVLGKKGGNFDGAMASASTSVLEEEQAIDVASLLSSSDSDGDAPRKNSKKKSGNSKGASSVSSGVRLENVSKNYKGVTVLKDVSWEVKKGEKVGLVGVNGAGKTTQLRIIAGLEEPDSGNIVRVKDNMKVAFLNQEFEVCPTRTVKEEFQSAFKEEMEILTRLKMVEKALEGSVEDQELMGRLLDELDLLQRRSRDLDVSSLDARISKLMPTLGFASEDADRLVASFSGGWQMRMCLGKILLEEPDLLLLDEPTNHIDLDTIEWLEGYLAMQEVPMVIISHDRAFLDQLCTKIVETEMGVARTFLGNYSQYVLSKAEWIETQYTAWERQQKKIEHNKDLINRLGGGANSGRASAAGKTLEKLQEEKVEKPFQRKQMKIRFPERGRSGRNVLSIKNLEFGYGDEMLLKQANLFVERGEKIAILGPNGCGKSTLLKLIMGLEKPTRGKISLGEHNILPNYFEQNQAEALDLEKNVLQTVEEAAVDWRMDDIKGLLGRCNFKAEMLGRKVALLSGGEKARLAFCKFMVKPSTLLVLDEPTNHLDIPSKEMLEEAIANYKGTVITVSHDRYFIKQIVNRVIEVKDGHIQDYEGDYNYFLEKNLEARDRELERALEIEGKGPKAKSKVKLTKEQKEARKKQRREAFQRANQKSKLLKNAKRWN